MFFLAKKKKKSKLCRKEQREKKLVHRGLPSKKSEGKNLQKQSGSLFRRSTRPTHTRARAHII